MVVDVKYGSRWGGLCSNGVIGSYGFGLWKFIRRGLEEFSTYARFEVGDGSMISFWHDVWCGEQLFKVGFSKLYNMLALRMLLWQITFSSLMALFSGTLILLERHMIGSWNSFPHFLISCIPSNWNRMAWTSFVGTSLREGCLMLKRSIMS